MWLLPLAAAHPYADHLAADGTAALGHRLEVRVGADRVELAYSAEVPPPVLSAEFAGREDLAEPAAERARELPDGLKARWNGVTLPLGQVSAPGAHLNPDGLWELETRLAAPRPAGGGRLEVVNTNYPDRFAYYYAEVSVPGDLVVGATSLAEVKDGRVWSNVHGSWGRSPTARELWVDLRRAWPWQRQADAAPLPERLAGTNALAAPWSWKVGGGILAALLLVVVYRGLQRPSRSP